MSTRPPKASLVRVSLKAAIGNSHKKPKFTHNSFAKKDRPGSTPSAVIPPTALSPPTFVDLDRALENAPAFDESIDDLSFFTPGGFSKGKEKVPPSLLVDEDQAVAHLRSMLFDSDLGSLRSNNTSSLVSSTLFDLRKESASFGLSI